MVESPSPLLVIVSLPAYPLNVKSQSSKSLLSACGSGFPTLMSSGRGFDTYCPIVLTDSVSPVYYDVASLTIHDYTYLYENIYKKKHETIVEGPKLL